MVSRLVVDSTALINAVYSSFGRPTSILYLRVRSFFVHCVGCRIVPRVDHEIQPHAVEDVWTYNRRLVVTHKAYLVSVNNQSHSHQAVPCIVERENMSITTPKEDLHNKMGVF